ncbi:BEM_collapsed_G0009490.mRNA.1.CDS.1 [Saccharomyces cerevisiae]|nr:BEM_collapsed_G0009490.mRNA.1.CDS.1 [Saccharomyces cerevisiae]
MEQILYNQSLKISTLSTFQGLKFLKVLIFSIFQQLFYNPVIQLFGTKASIMESDSTTLLESSWSTERNFLNMNSDSISTTKNVFILFFTIFRLAEYIVYKLSDQKYRLRTSLNVQHFRWNSKKNTNRKKDTFL